MPLVRMTFPASSITDLREAPLNQPIAACWLLAFGFIPFDRHVLIMHEVGERHFIETSHSAMQKLWRHERYVTPTASGCTVRDVITVVPRLGFAEGASRAIVPAIFRHRHRQLRKLYG